MARLDAAARFTPALTKLATDAACEPATTMDAEIVRSAVKDRENAADVARSRFSMISNKSISVTEKCRSMALHTKPTVHFRHQQRCQEPHTGRKLRWKSAFPDQKSRIHWNLLVGVRFAEFASFWPSNCFKLPARKQAIGHCFCRIRENPGANRHRGTHVVGPRMPVWSRFRGVFSRNSPRNF